MKKQNNLWQAVSDFQQDCPVIEKSTQAFKYKYADLPSIMNVITPLLRKHGLVLSQPLHGNNIKTILTHLESGEQLVSECEIPQNVELAGMNAFQTQGSAITYYRRYSLSMLGIITDKDTDAQGKQVQTKAAKKVMTVGSDAFKKAVRAIQDGYDRDRIEKYYVVNDNVWAEILKQAES